MVAQSMIESIELFKSSVTSGNSAVASTKLNDLKEMILELYATSPKALSSEYNLVKDFFEFACIFSVDSGDELSFQQYLSSLKSMYTSATPESSLQPTILGLNLLNLLVNNKLAEFHCELELLSDSQRKHPAVVFCRQLDQHLMVGSYDQVLSAAATPPVEQYRFFLKSLLKTVRINIGDCAVAAYNTLEIQAATKMLMFRNDQETIEFIKEVYPDWVVKDNIIYLQMTRHTPKSEEIPSHKILEQQLTYASELERIV